MIARAILVVALIVGGTFARAAVPGFELITLTRETPHGPQVVSILGERHIKSKADAALGRRIVEGFEVFGVEARRFGDTWAGRALKILRIERSPPFWRDRLRAAGHVDGWTEGSTIEEVHRQRWRRMFYDRVAHADRDFLRIFAAQIRAGEGDDFVNVDGVSILTRRDALEMIRARHDGLLPYLPALPPATVHDLEFDHRPGLAEQLEALGLVQFGGLYFAIPALLGSIVFHVSTGSSLSSTFSTYAAILAWIGYVEVGDRLIRDLRRYDARWYRALFPVHVGPVIGRDDTMARNIARIAEPEVLVIVGKAHLSGLRRRLEAVGYRAVDPVATSSSTVGSDADACARRLLADQ